MVVNKAPEKADFCLRISADRLAAFIFKDAKVEIIKDPDGNQQTEYIVSFANDKVIIGQGAKEDLKIHPESVIYDFFDMLGLDDEELSFNDKWEFCVFEPENGEIEIGYINGEKQCRIQVIDLMALFLHAVKKNVDAYLGYESKTVKVHVQLGISKSQKEKVLQAAKMIGLRVL